MMTKCLERERTLRHFQSYTHKQKERRNRNEKAASIGGSDKDPEPEDGAKARGRPARRQKNSLRVDEAISISTFCATPGGKTDKT